MSFARRPRLVCLLCQRRSFVTSYRRLAENAQTPAAKPTAETPKPQKFIPPNPLEDAPKGWGKRVAEFTPVPLPRPIGMPYPPEPGQNTGLDPRTLKQRRDDFVNWDKHLARREELKSEMRKPYFRDWTNLELHKGKTFICPPRLFKGDLSLWFPNLYGTTLSRSDPGPRDTTPVLAGKISVVSLFSGQWAEGQAKSFVSKEANPELLKVLEQNKEKAQLFRVNVEDDRLKAFLIKMFMGSIRKSVGEENWDRYFLVTKAISQDLREGIGLLNSKVGYTYLLDPECRIRWAGSGFAEDHEKESLVKGVQRLLEDSKRTETKGSAAKKAPSV